MEGGLEVMISPALYYYSCAFLYITVGPLPIKLLYFKIAREPNKKHNSIGSVVREKERDIWIIHIWIDI